MSALAVTLLQILVIVISGHLLGRALNRIGQPFVIGEIAAGILLGPSLFGRIAPDAFATLFPSDSITTLQSLSQVGLVLFMFLVGLEFAPELFRERRKSVVIISHVSIVVPFLLGMALAVVLYPRVADPRVPFRDFALFLGIAMSITAFPVLARILSERHLMKTRVGSTAIGCAAVDDVTAWCVLAGVVMLVRAGDLLELAVKVALVAIYVIGMLFVVRPLLQRARSLHFAAVLMLAIASAWTTELLGIHALFGAFLAGAIIPRDKELNASLTQQIHGVTSVIFLPLFFAVTGLRTNVGLLQSPMLWMCAALVLITAIAGKFGGATLAAAASGFPWREATAIGILMNTRGLMEMIVVNIGLDIGVVSRPLYTMIVLMALVTTAMAAPLLDLVVPRIREVEKPADSAAV
jgi:Kef-type K+ transport system membrane component KefB